MNKSSIQKSFYNSTIPSDWEVKTVGEAFKICNNLRFPISEEERRKIKGEYPYYGPTKIQDYINEYRIEGKYALIGEDGDHFLKWKELPMTLLVEGKFNVNNHAHIVQGETNLTEWFFYYFNHRELTQHLTRQGAGRYKLTKDALSKILCPLPPIPEQKAIAHVISLMDTVINKNNLLLAKKELQRNWLMQNLLTGKKRLKGFNGEWDKYHLGSLGETYTGLTGKSKEDFGEGKPYIPYLNIFNNPKIDINNFDFVMISSTDNQNKVQYGDIFFTVSSETPDEVGMASVMLDNVAELYLNSFCFGFRLHDFKVLVPEFSSHFLRADAFREEVYKLSQGATRFNLSKNNLMKLDIIIPSLKEQTAIAQVLQTADKEIGLLKTKTEKLREKKKGLMQMLLTGRKD